MIIPRFICDPQVEVAPSRSFAQYQVHQDILGQCQITPKIQGGDNTRETTHQGLELEDLQGSASFNPTLVQEC